MRRRDSMTATVTSTHTQSTQDDSLDSATIRKFSSPSTFTSPLLQQHQRRSFGGTSSPAAFSNNNGIDSGGGGSGGGGGNVQGGGGSGNRGNTSSGLLNIASSSSAYDSGPALIIGGFSFSFSSGAGGSMKGPEAASTLAAPLDGGWGWFVVFGSFMIHVVADGVTYSFGIFYTELLEYFNAGKGATSWISSILVGVTLCSGPLSSALVNRWNCRTVTIAGAILASIGLALSSLAQNVATLYITAGFTTGLGLGLIYLPAIVCVTIYFDKYRSLATGIAVCGSGFGTFVFAPLTEFFIQRYEWRGAFLVIAAIMLSCIFFGILFRPLEASNDVELPEMMTPMIKENGTPSLKNGNVTALQNGIPSGNQQRPHSIHGERCLVATASTTSETASRLARSQPQLALGSGAMYRRDILYRGSLANIPQHQRSTSHPGDSKNGLGERQPSMVRSINQDKPANCCGVFSFPREASDVFSEMLDFSLFKDVVFVLFTASNFCTSIGFYVPYIYINDFALKRNIERTEASYLLSIVGVANTVGRIILGYISDKPWVNRLWIYNTSLTICGIATALCVYCENFYTFAIFASVFGFTVGAYVGLTSVILVDLLGLDKLTNAFGLLLLFQGLASLIGPPITGWLYDATSSYSPGFVFSGLMIAISGLMLFIVPTLRRYLERKKMRKIGELSVAVSS